MRTRNGSNRSEGLSVAWLGGVALIAGLSLTTARAGAQTPTPAPIDPELARGETLYRIYCSSCHGTQGKGDGPVASALRVRPSDLTTLARRAGGDFPEARLRDYVDGRTEVPAHGARDMPVWGLSFAERGSDTDQEREIAAEIRALVRYLRSIQRR
jgi:mono/diheme cytochrome c family protein